MHGIHEPPQSTPTSSPFFNPSLHVAHGHARPQNKSQPCCLFQTLRFGRDLQTREISTSSLISLCSRSSCSRRSSHALDPARSQSCFERRPVSRSIWIRSRVARVPRRKKCAFGFEDIEAAAAEVVSVNGAFLVMGFCPGAENYVVSTQLRLGS